MNRLSDNWIAFDAKLPYNEHNRTVERICTLTGWKGGGQMLYTIEEIRTKAMPVAIRYDVDALSLFGSYARGDADDKSDLDFLVLKGNMKGLLSYCGMIADLEDIFHCHVDLVIKNAIRDEKFLEEISRDEVNLYERKNGLFFKK